MDTRAGMSTPFLMSFSMALVARLERERLLELALGQRERVVIYVANYLDTIARGGSLLSNVEAALLACPEVEELYADIDELKRIVEDLEA